MDDDADADDDDAVEEDIVDGNVVPLLAVNGGKNPEGKLYNGG